MRALATRPTRGAAALGRSSAKPAARKAVVRAPASNVVAWDGTTFRCRVNVKTTNPNNGATGHSRLAGIIRSRERRMQREATKSALLVTQWKAASYHRGNAVTFPNPVVVTMRRVAPSDGLDPHDGLRAALKGPVDGVADWLGLKSDRDPRVSWTYDQRRGRPGEYAVEIQISHAVKGETKP